MKATRIIALILAVVLIVLSAGMSWAVAQDYAVRDLVAQGATATGVPGQAPIDLGGMTSSEARAAIQQRLVDPLLQQISVQAKPTGTYSVDPGRFVTVDVDAMVRDAMSPTLRVSVPERVARRLADRPIHVAVPIALKIDTHKLDVWAKRFERQVGRSALDSTLTVSQVGVLTISTCRDGYSVDHSVAYKAAYDALIHNVKAIELTIAVIKPAKTPNSFGKTIIVRRGKHRVWLYTGRKLEVTYPVAIGTPGHPTPLGLWKIVNKVKNPSWNNPHAAWSGSMPEYIPPGPSNPLGTRALYLNASGIRFHGTNNINSVGTAASHGCMRMYMHDVEDFYPRVPIGTRVYILP